MRVAVTGAEGFTGRFVVDALLAKGLECVALTCDLTDAADVERAIGSTAFDRVIHLAGAAFVAASDWRSFYAVNQIGTFNLLDAVARARAGSRVVMASSAQVYGSGAEGLISEDADTAPGNHYAVSKLAMEQGAVLWKDKLEIIISRPFNYTGVGQSDGYLVPKLVEHFRRRAPEIELGNIWVKRDFGDVRAVADAYVGLMLAEDTPPLLNISTGVVSSIEDILKILTTTSGHRIVVKENPALMRTNDVPVLGGRNDRLRQVLPDWRPRSLDDTLAWMYAEQTNAGQIAGG